MRRKSLAILTAALLALAFAAGAIAQSKTTAKPVRKPIVKGKAKMSKPSASVTAPISGPVSCPVAKDTWVYIFRPDRNYGDGLGWKDRTDPTQDLTVPKMFLGFGGSDKKLALVAFDISKLPKGQIPSKATLRLFNDFAGSAAATEVQAKQVLGEWDELKVTWKTRPQLSAAASTAMLSGAIGYGQDGKWYEWDVTAIVKAWAGGQPNYGIALDPLGDSGVDRDIVCREYAQKAAFAPVLAVEYGGQPDQTKK
jgi:hypothetical protein